MLASIPVPDTDFGPSTVKYFPSIGWWLFPLLSLVAIFLFCTPRAEAQSGLPPIDARAYILMNADTGAIIATKNAYRPYAIASITKLMTLYLLFKDIDSGHLQLNQRFVPCRAALQTGGSSMFMHPGLPFTIAQMILGMTVPSGNDAAVEAAHLVAGSVPAFVAEMNRTARKIGMLSTTFYDPDGLPHPNNMASPYDVAVLTRTLMTQFPQFMPFFRHENFTYAGITSPNPNLLVGRVPFITGMKSGYTDAAGHCLVATGTQDGIRLIAVILGVPSFRDEGRGFWRASWQSLKLLDWGFARTLWLPSVPHLERTSAR
ncbi:D-alanyl-D-alanine carboxypeptidase [Acidithiobacillus sp. 'AMD consortium']|uniref:D-alanyl-D-alanine carboxypeptidase DacF n=2 Tax=Acidithiobacillus ferridurans TaxID=1232575 RepID=A0A2Z6IKA3_ACIFI|nr:MULTISPECIES: D-alanyl-D-alanine carboxypeptidase family protein [Acidithiobacillus]MBU2716785.1 D-alanyl-D-alanine carboxypeptidase [Acidithiobacillus ferridurans]MBU2719743.1 D-alanyl-D-alanine carboxypeptidase [Acidithiobacillus ferridurans]MBU2722425.1 D-alanyl-D-alanine carboxypeptidase [Acidithiobacillus ferridurans]MBU2727745.1 D-alanyl-D-alanine carboxypeptidase [Acidithiobacillus ferridurans]QFG78920.1 D-alanyl-D-alanine carboxypeptidase [Acidithiobacillus sp. 'AMD consortium']